MGLACLAYDYAIIPLINEKTLSISQDENSIEITRFIYEPH